MLLCRRSGDGKCGPGRIDGLFCGHGIWYAALYSGFLHGSALQRGADDAVCHCRHKHRTEKEEKDLLTRLNRIEGQVRGIKAMVQDERYCPDILVQVSAVQSALNGFCKVLLSNHIKTCVVEDIKNGNEETAVAELCETIKKMM